MRPLHDRMLGEVFAERTRLMSRRRLMTNSLKVAGGGVIALAASGVPLLPGIGVARAQTTFESDADVLNYALTLEHLEYAFYRDGLQQFTDADLGVSPFGAPISERLAQIRDHELAHVETLTSVIADLGGAPVAEAQYDFGVVDVALFLTTAQALENTGVSAYDGAGQFLENAELLTAAGSIVAVEARHASYLNLLNGALPFPAPFETPLSPEEVLAIAGPFIVGADAAATPVAQATPAG